MDAAAWGGQIACEGTWVSKALHGCLGTDAASAFLPAIEEDEEPSESLCRGPSRVPPPPPLSEVPSETQTSSPCLALSSSAVEAPMSNGAVAAQISNGAAAAVAAVGGSSGELDQRGLQLHAVQCINVGVFVFKGSAERMNIVNLQLVSEEGIGRW